MIAKQTLSEIFRDIDTDAPEGWCVGALVLAAQRHLRGSSAGRLTATEWREVVTYVGFQTGLAVPTGLASGLHQFAPAGYAGSSANACGD